MCVCLFVHPISDGNVQYDPWKPNIMWRTTISLRTDGLNSIHERTVIDKLANHHSCFVAAQSVECDVTWAPILLELQLASVSAKVRLLSRCHNNYFKTRRNREMFTQVGQARIITWKNFFLGACKLHIIAYLRHHYEVLITRCAVPSFYAEERGPANASLAQIGQRRHAKPFFAIPMSKLRH